MSNALKFLVKPRLRFFFGGIIIGCLGIFLLFVNARHNNRYNWRPVKLQIVVEAGKSFQESFIAELDQAYEVELEIEKKMSSEKLKQLVMTTDAPSTLEINWQVIQDNEVKAQGNCHDYLYVRGTTSSFIGKFFAKILNIPYYQDIEGNNKRMRGVGRFRARKGEKYEFHVTIGKTTPELAAANPLLGVRVNRQFVTRHFESMIGVAKAGLILLGISITLVSWWGLSVTIEKVFPL